MKKLSVILITLLALTFSVTFTSCTEDGILPIRNDTPLLPDNALNPYDYYGQQHNEGVQDLLDNFGDEITARKSTDPLGAEVFIFEKALDKAGVDMKYHQELRNAFELNEKETIKSRDFFDLEKLLKPSPFNPHEITALQTIVDEVSQMPHSTTKELNSIIKKIISIEAKYTLDQEIENDRAFFGALSVMRYSAHLWGNNPDAKPLARRPWWQIVLGDCIGAAVGTLLGGPATGVGLGIGVSTSLK